MASELRVNTLKDAAGNNSVGMAYVSNGSAKAWITYNMVTAAVSDSLNISSITDNSTGQFFIDKTSAFSDINHSITGSSSITAAGGLAWTNFLDYESVLPETTTRHGQASYTSSAFNDIAYATGHIHGDLA